MATWKRLTGAVDSSAQSFLKNKRFSREKKKFTWDWHAWNLALVSTPSLLLAYYLHGVEKRMQEEAVIREEIQERTGVSSRGFLIPKREVREEVLGMLSAGNQRGITTSGEDGGGAELTRQGHDGEEALEGNMPADLASINRRLADLERMLSVQGDSSSTAGVGVDDGAGRSTDSMLGSTFGSSQGKDVASARNTASKADNSGGDAAHGMSTVDKAIETASAAGSWVVKTGESQAKRLLQLGRDWLAEENRQEGAIHSEKSGLSKDEATEHHAPEKTVAEVWRQQERLPAGKSLDSVGPSSSSTGEGTAVSTRSDGKGHTEGAWRRGRLDGNDNQR